MRILIFPIFLCGGKNPWKVVQKASVERASFLNTIPLNLKKHYAGCRRNTHFVKKSLRRSPQRISKKSMPSRSEIFADVLTAEFPSVSILNISTQLLTYLCTKPRNHLNHTQLLCGNYAGSAYAIWHSFLCWAYSNKN